MYRTLRPTGNKVSLKSTPLSDDFFAPYHVQFVQSGTAALAAAILAAIKKAKMQRHISAPIIILPAYACPDLISATLYAGAKPLLIDFIPNRPWLDIPAIEAVIDASIVAIIAMNFMGIPEQMSDLKRLSMKHNITLIEDSAQGFPLSINASYWSGDIVISSFGRGKPLSLLHGGIILSTESKLFDLLPHLEILGESLFSKLKYYLKVNIYNLMTKPLLYHWLLRIPGLKVGETIFKPLNKLESCPNFIKKLISRNYELYANKELITRKFHTMLTRINSEFIIDLPEACGFNMDMPLLRYPILITDSSIHQVLRTELTKMGLGASIMYEKILPNITGVDKSWFSQIQNYPNASLFAQQLLTLPTHEDVSHQDIAKIENLFQKHCEK